MITHILVNDPWALIPDFLYPGCCGVFKDPKTGKRLKSSDAHLDLAEVPFVPLRYLFKRDLQKSAGSYLQLVQQLRTRAINLENELSLQVRPTIGEIKINERFIRLSPNEFLFYCYFAQRAADGDPPVESLASIVGELKSLQEQYRSEMDLGHWASKVLQGQFDPNEDLRKWAGNHTRNSCLCPEGWLRCQS